MDELDTRAERAIHRDPPMPYEQCRGEGRTTPSRRRPGTAPRSHLAPYSVQRSANVSTETTASATERSGNRPSCQVSIEVDTSKDCLLYTSPSPRDGLLSRMPSS